MSKNGECSAVEEELDAEPKSVILSMIGQLRKDMDLSRVTFPTFVLEPRSFTERVTDFMSHPDFLISSSKCEDPVERFIGVVKYYMSGWHIRPKGVKKPYNPVLGEFFRSKYEFDDGSSAFFVAEQVSHHPPITAMFYNSPEHRIAIEGDLRPKSRFFGNSVGMLLEGYAMIHFLNRSEQYLVTYPNMYARGILFGKMVLELGEVSTVTCKESDLMFEVEFKTKGILWGSYNQISGKIRRISTREVLFDIEGNWQTVMYITDKRNPQSSPKVLFDASTERVVPQTVACTGEQEPNESRNFWKDVTKAICDEDLNAATTYKSAIEEQQRLNAKDRENRKEHYVPRFFQLEIDGHYHPKMLLNELSEDSEEAKEKICKWIFTRPDGEMQNFKRLEDDPVVLATPTKNRRKS
ncbi:Oxysterol-binding protein [Coemansia reversa NRRL 1564]|uniref:Oxysterol-binding protein n=1 Tax=Coemansia reversa (strain ATCC 12441 / NRRL 1564) TaxID=763665 RepID=A0A2G5B7Y5_COERN|nr:Oxysterol-binding protein [Coemansia reversa NRRL 1564]|eukprot:PIA15119.1 Oxysterol-binding protein [Coemansia reversa NRRL 1564]